MRLIICILLYSTFFAAHSLSLNVGLLSDDPPFSIQVSKNNIFSGFEVQLMAEICKRLPADCHYQPLQLQDFFTQIDAKKIDLAIGQISITLPRESHYLFTLPYMTSIAKFITTANSPIKTLNDIKSKTIGVYKDSFLKGYLRQEYNNQITLAEYETTKEAFQALLNGDVDILLLDNNDENYWIANSDYEMKDFRIIGQPINMSTGYGIMANLQSVQLINQINKILVEMESDGSYLKIYNIYFGGI